MSDFDQDDAQRTVFWVLGAIVTLLLGAIIWWKLMSSSSPGTELVSEPATVETPAISAPEEPVSIPAPVIGDDLPKSLGELSMSFDQANGLTIQGSVPTDRKKDRLLSQAKLVFGENRVVDQLMVVESAALPNWKGKTLDLMAKLASVGPFKLLLKDNQVNFSAEVQDDSLKSAWIDWLANFFVDQPLAVNADQLVVNPNLTAVTSFDNSTLFNLAVNFASGSAEIPTDAIATLESAAQILKEDGRTLRIVGHTDATGQADANRVLSTSRAEAVYNFLISKGVNPQTLSFYGLGQDQPIADNDTETGRAKNRRIEFAQ
jgi:OmpA-OmpF porin, OOP family